MNQRSAKPQRGVSYVEVLVATSLIAISIVPLMNALNASLQTSDTSASSTPLTYYLTAKLDEVLADPYGLLDAAATVAGNESTPSEYSDLAGSTNRRLVFLSRYDADDGDGDGDGFTGTDPDLLWIRVELENSTLAIETMVCR